eukprot:scaffold49_cov115-Isochrysis_galbana.AAC.6
MDCGAQRGQHASRVSTRVPDAAGGRARTAVGAAQLSGGSGAGGGRAGPRERAAIRHRPLPDEAEPGGRAGAAARARAPSRRHRLLLAASRGALRGIPPQAGAAEPAGSAGSRGSVFLAVPGPGARAGPATHRLPPGGRRHRVQRGAVRCGADGARAAALRPRHHPPPL